MNIYGCLIAEHYYFSLLCTSHFLLLATAIYWAITMCQTLY